MASRNFLLLGLSVSAASQGHRCDRCAVRPVYPPRCPRHIRSDNGPEFVAKAVREWIAAVGAKAAYIEPGSSWENGYIESFNARLRDELLNGEIFCSLKEAPIIELAPRRLGPQAYGDKGYKQLPAMPETDPKLQRLLPQCALRAFHQL